MTQNLLILALSLIFFSLEAAEISLPIGTSCSEPVSNKSVVNVEYLLNKIDVLQAQLDTIFEKIDVETCGRTAAHVETSCSSVKACFDAKGITPESRSYWLKPSTSPMMEAYCDFSLGGEPWMLVMNYYHKSSVSSVDVALTSSLPLYTERSVGIDGSFYSTEWGHAAPSLLSQFPFSEIRFYCKGDSAAENIHFSSSHNLNYFKTGTGDYYNGLKTSGFTTLTGHYESRLPAITDSGYQNQGDSAVNSFPFYVNAGTEYRYAARYLAGNGYYYLCNQPASVKNTKNGHWQAFIR